MANNQFTSTKVITDPVRLAFCHLFEPYGKDGQQAKYSCVIMVPKSNKALMDKMLAALEAARLGSAGKFNGKVPTALENTIKDGDNPLPKNVDFIEEHPEFKGHWYLTVSAKTRPGLVDQNVNPIMDQSELYSGVWARVSINAYAYNTSGNRGLTFGLNNVQKVRDDEPFGGRVSAESEFAPITDDSGNDLGEGLI